MDHRERAESLMDVANRDRSHSLGPPGLPAVFRAFCAEDGSAPIGPEERTRRKSEGKDQLTFPKRRPRRGGIPSPRRQNAQFLRRRGSTLSPSPEFDVLTSLMETS